MEYAKISVGFYNMRVFYLLIFVSISFGFLESGRSILGEEPQSTTGRLLIFCAVDEYKDCIRYFGSQVRLLSCESITLRSFIGVLVSS